jgi:hypothetical protein
MLLAYTTVVEKAVLPVSAAVMMEISVNVTDMHKE